MLRNGGGQRGSAQGADAGVARPAEGGLRDKPTAGAAVELRPGVVRVDVEVAGVA